MKNKLNFQGCCLTLFLVMVLITFNTACTPPSKNTSLALITSSTSKTTLTNSLSSIMVESPLSVNLGVGYKLLFNAIGTYSDGARAEITSKVTWTSSNPAVASISSDGMATGITVGTTEITASLSGVTSPAITLVVYLETRTPITP
jgi:hypothetical protein